MFTEKFRDMVVNDYFTSGKTMYSFCKNQVSDVNPISLNYWITDFRRRNKELDQSVQEIEMCKQLKGRQSRRKLNLQYYSTCDWSEENNLEDVSSIYDYEVTDTKSPVTLVCFEMPKAKKTQSMEVNIPTSELESKLQFNQHLSKICSNFLDLEYNNTNLVFLKEVMEELNELTI
jgi:hypothetical protein